MRKERQDAGNMLADERRAEFEEHGLIVVPGALSADLLARVTEAHDRVYEAERRAGRLAEDGALHLLAFIARDDVFLELLDLPTTFPLVANVLGWNIFMYHCHLDAHPPVAANAVPAWRWHQDGGRQNLELESDPRPRLSVKVAYFLTDVSEPGCGNLLVVPGSHTRNTLPRPDRPELDFHQPAGATPVLAEAGSAVIFDRRLWHARSENGSQRTRKALFLGYTYRWIRPRDDHSLEPARLRRLTPVRRQLLGDGRSTQGYWLPTDEDVPLRRRLERRPSPPRRRPRRAPPARPPEP